MTEQRTFIQDVREQPKVFDDVTSFYGSKAGQILLDSARQLAEGAHFDVLFTGMGSSYAVSRFAATYLWSAGIKARFVEASELLHYGLGAFDNTLLVLISQSGESVEIRGILDVLPAGVKTIGITEKMESTLARKSTIVLPIFSGDESTTSSKTYTSCIAVAFLLAQAMAGLELSDVIQEMRKASSDISSLLEQESSVAERLAGEKFRKAKSIHFIGRGAGLATAFQGALMFKELVKIQVECMEAAQFRHGPMETVGTDTVIVVFAPAGKTDTILLSFAKELKGFGAAVFVVRDGLISDNVSVLENLANNETPHVIREFASALVDILPIQRIGHELSVQLGTTGAFKRITKVTSKE
jgi:glucosamine--fructose-6-phosphate aminotransferase (isomerizing)